VQNDAVTRTVRITKGREGAPRPALWVGVVAGTLIVGFACVAYPPIAAVVALLYLVRNWGPLGEPR
jgi:hypothetical protein